MKWALSRGNALIGAGMASMLVKGVRHHHGTTVTLVTYEAQFVMYHPQVVNNGTLILSIFSAPRAVGITSKMPEVIGVMSLL